MRITEMQNLLNAFISFKSVAESEIQKQECLDWIMSTFLRDKLSDLKRGVFESSPWIYLPHPQSKLLIFAHVDVVPAKEEQFYLKVEGDKAIGRGTSDMKGNILPFLIAIQEAWDEGGDPPISILITTDEEVAGKTIPYLLGEGIIKDPAAFTPDSNDEGIVVEHKGVVWAKLTALGKGGHGAYPWNTQNPNFLLAKALTALEDAFPRGGNDDWQMTVTPTMLEGSKAQNQVATIATAGIDIRYPGSQYSSVEQVLTKVRSVLPENCTLEEGISASPLHTDKQNPMVMLYKSIAEDVIGKPIPFKREHGGTDARYFSEKGIAAFLYGPTGAGLHSDDEWVSLSSLERHYEIYRRLFALL